MRWILIASMLFSAAPHHPLPIFPEGKLKKTNRAFDLAIEGPGFFQVQAPNGEIFYTRDGQFQLDFSNRLITRDGFVLQPPITVPSDAVAFSVPIDGVAGVVQGGAQVQLVGNMQLSMFRNPLGLKRSGKNFYSVTAESGDPMMGNPGELSLGRIRQGYIERLPKVKLDEDHIDN